MKKIIITCVCLLLLGLVATAMAAPDIEKLLMSPKIFRLTEIREPEALLAEIKKASLRTEEATALLTVYMFDEKDIPLLQVTLDAGADPNMEFNNEGITPLMIAIAGEGNEECARYLMAHGADVNKITSSGLTALLMATLVSDMPAKWISFLLQNGADANITLEDLRPLDLAYINPKLRNTPALTELKNATTIKGFMEDF